MTKTFTNSRELLFAVAFTVVAHIVAFSAALTYATA